MESAPRISNDWVIRYEGRCLQLEPGQRRYGPAKSQALVCEYEDGSLAVHYRGKRIGLHEIAEPIRKTRPPAAGLRRGMLGRRKPKPDYRWREGYAPYSLTVPPAGLAAPVVLRPSAPP